MTKVTGLAAFTRPAESFAKAAEPNGAAPPKTSPKKPRRKRGEGEVVSLPVRLVREEWLRVNALAMAEWPSFQAMAIDALSRLFEERGLPPLKGTES